MGLITKIVGIMTLIVLALGLVFYTDQTIKLLGNLIKLIVAVAKWLWVNGLPLVQKCLEWLAKAIGMISAKIQ